MRYVKIHMRSAHLPCLQVELRNMDTGDLYSFTCNFWLSKTMGDGRLSKDVAASVRGKLQVKSEYI